MNCPNCHYELTRKFPTGRCCLCDTKVTGLRRYCIPCGREMRRLSWRTYHRKDYQEQKRRAATPARWGLDRKRRPLAVIRDSVA